MCIEVGLVSTKPDMPGLIETRAYWEAIRHHTPRLGLLYPTHYTQLNAYNIS